MVSGARKIWKILDASFSAIASTGRTDVLYFLYKMIWFDPPERFLVLHFQLASTERTDVLYFLYKEISLDAPKLLLFDAIKYSAISHFQ